MKIDKDGKAYTVGGVRAPHEDRVVQAGIDPLVAEIEAIKRAKVAEARLADALAVLEPFALMSSEGIVKGQTGYTTVTTCAEYFHRAKTFRDQFKPGATLSRLKPGEKGCE